MFHNYELLLICLNILMYESHWEPQTQYITFFKKKELPKNNNEYDNSVIYGLSWATYKLNYVGQTCGY